MSTRSRQTTRLVAVAMIAGIMALSSLANPTALVQRLMPGGAAVATGASTMAQTAAPAQAAPAVVATDPTTAAIQAVIQRANQEQQDAFAQQDPTIMQDTATPGYYAQLVQINQAMAAAGTVDIRLISLDWGPVTLVDATTARATTYETWQTTDATGATIQSRDVNVYTLVALQGGWVIQSDQHPNVTPSPASSPSGAVAPSDSQAPNQASVSQNWSGYAATGGSFTAVTGTWTVPSVQPSVAAGARGAASAAWVGIGGVTTRDLIQAGTEEMTTRAGVVRYQAWIETLPQPSQPVPLTVHPGDSITVAITQQGVDTWLIAFTNNTTGQTYQTTVYYTSSLSSAEWVQEAPSSGRGLVALDNFGTVPFSAGSSVKDGTSMTLSQAGAQPITMIDQYGNALAVPSALTSDGAGFTVTRTAVTPITPALPGRGRQGRAAA